MRRGLLGLVLVEGGVAWNLAFLGLAAILIWRFVRSDGIELLLHVDEPHGHEHAHAWAVGKASPLRLQTDRRRCLGKQRRPTNAIS